MVCFMAVCSELEVVERIVCVPFAPHRPKYWLKFIKFQIIFIFYW